MKNNLKIWFEDMWGFENYQFNPQDNYFTDLFNVKFNVHITNENPDLLVYSVFGRNHLKYNCKKILFSGEHLGAGKNNVDHYNYSNVTLSHYEDLDKEIFLPLWVIFVNWFNKQQPRPLPSNPTYTVSFDKIQNNRDRFLNKRKFCAFINNNNIKDRVDFFEALNNFERVDSYGQLLNNMGFALRGSQQDKINLLNDYKFNIAFENCYHTGYNTEKIIEPLESGCIPLYKGGEKVTEYFNNKSFLFYKNYNNISSFTEAVLNIHRDKDFYEDMVLAKPLRLDNIYRDFSPDAVLSKILSKLNL